MGDTSDTYVVSQHFAVPNRFAIYEEKGGKRNSTVLQNCLVVVTTKDILQYIKRTTCTGHVEPTGNSDTKRILPASEFSIILLVLQQVQIYTKVCRNLHNKSCDPQMSLQTSGQVEIVTRAYITTELAKRLEN